MSIIEELQLKLSETRESVEEVIKDLREFSQIKESLKSANEGVHKASDNLDSLTRALKTSTEALSAATEKLGDVIEIVRSTDPAELLEGQKQIESSIRQIDEKIGGIISDGEKVKDRVEGISWKILLIIIMIAANAALIGYFIKMLIGQS